jgi:ubiquinone biosynthesis protein
VRIKTIANIGRFKDIVFTLFKYGFEDLVGHLEFPGKSEAKKADKVDRRIATYERFRMALEDLGPTFIKFGQIMSLRSDLLPGALVMELRKLQDEVAPFDFVSAKKVVEQSLQKSLEDVFVVFEEKPVAAASLSQVHRAVLKESRQAVAVKVQRPYIRNKVATDLDILEYLSEMLQDRLAELEIYDFPGLVRLTRRNIERELNFKREVRYMTIARSHLGDLEGVKIPKPYPEFSTANLLVMEMMDGKKLKDFNLEKLENPEILARCGLRVTIKQILEDGFFHADPHPGNLLISENNTLSLLDWGMVGRLTDADRYELIEFLYAIVDKDSRRLVDALLVITIQEDEINQRRLERDLLDILDSYLSVPLKDLNLASLILDITDLLHEYHLRLPPDLFIMLKALITAEGTARLLYPELDAISEAEPFLRQVSAQRFKPAPLWRKFKTIINKLFTYRGDFSRQVFGIIKKIDEGEINLKFEHQNLGGLQNTLENIFSRLTFGIIIASMVISSSMIITTGVKPLLFGFPAIGIIGYFISAIAGMWVVYNIIKSRRY